jgi:hypothetical protein
MADFDVVEGPFASPGPEPKFADPDPAETDTDVCNVCGFKAKSVHGMRTHRRMKHGDKAPVGAPTPINTATLKQQAEAFAMFFYGLGGGLLSNVDPVCGPALVSCQEAAAAAWYQAALVNPTVRKIIGSTEQVGVWGGLFMAHMPLIEAVREHHLTRHPEPEPADDSEITFADDAS